MKSKRNKIHKIKGNKISSSAAGNQWGLTKCNFLYDAHTNITTKWDKVTCKGCLKKK